MRKTMVLVIYILLSSIFAFASTIIFEMALAPHAWKPV
jgi:hypothetical protein